MTSYKDIMPYFDKFMHVSGWNLSVLWSPLDIWMPKILQLPISGTQFLNPGQDHEPETFFKCCG